MIICLTGSISGALSSLLIAILITSNIYPAISANIAIAMMIPTIPKIPNPPDNNPVASPAPINPTPVMINAKNATIPSTT